MTEIIFREEVYKIVGVCMSVYNMLGYGFLEIIYKDAMEIEFSDKEMEFQREKII